MEMSETLSQDPDGLGVAYTTLAPSYPSTPATPNSTVQDLPPGANLPPFSTFSSDIDSNGAFGSVSDRFLSDTRLLDISNWDYYTETRLIERGENGLSIISSQPQYRPWESKPVDSTSAFAGTTQVNTFTDSFSPPNGASKLPSFQSQFQAFSESGNNSEPTLTTLTNLTPVSPNSASSPQSQTLTTLNSSFHTLSAVNPRTYPLVPAPIQAREIPSIQQQFLDERHIQLYSHPTANLTLNNTLHSASIFPTQNGAIIQNSQIISSPTVVTVLKSEPDLKLGGNITSFQQADTLKLQNVALHPSQFQSPMTALNSDSGLYNGIEKKRNGTGLLTSPTRNDFRKKERRKMRTNSLESSAESDGASSNMDLGSENSGQVAAVSSTDGFKNQHGLVGMEHDMSGGTMDKQTKKKRKRCGECVGCQRKDNCGDCAPCRNDKSHQICKQRRCEKLTEKKNLYGEPYMRGESRRGRGKGRGAASYRGRKPNGPLTALGGGLSEPNGVAPPQASSRPSPQPVTQPIPVQQQPMTAMPFYADPNRFSTPVWQADPSQVSGWQGQFIQQIPSAGQPIDTYQQYPNGIYQTTYQQPAFETNAFYTGAVQVLTPTNTRPPSVPNQQTQMIPPRPNSNYAHTPSPSPATAQQQPQQQAQQQNTNRQYSEYNQFNNTNSSNNDGSQSRPSSVSSVVNQNPPTPNQNYQQGGQSNQQQQNQTQQVYTNESTGSFSPGSNAQQTQFSNINGSGNGQPGYPQVNTSSPQVVSHNSSGYPGNDQYSGHQQQSQQQWQHNDHEQIIWDNNHTEQDIEENKIEHHNYEHQNEHHYMNQQQVQQENTSPTKMRSESPHRQFSQADKVNLNTRIKTMILNKQQNDKVEQEMKNAEQNQTTGHFLWYSHHHHLDLSGVDGGPMVLLQSDPRNTQRFAQLICKISINEHNELPDNNPTANHLPSQKNNCAKSVMEIINQSNHIRKTDSSCYIDSMAQEHQYIHFFKKNESKNLCNRHADNVISIPPCTRTAEFRSGQSAKLHGTFMKLPIELSFDGNCIDVRHVATSYGSDFALFEYHYTPLIMIFPYSTPKSYNYGKPSPIMEFAGEIVRFPNLKERHISLYERRTEHKLATKFVKDSPKLHCFVPHQSRHSGPCYTHSDCDGNLKAHRYNLGIQTKMQEAASGIKKLSYTCKGETTAQEYQIVKWEHPHITLEEIYLVIVKQQTGHICQSSYIVVCLVVLDGIPRQIFDVLCSPMTEKLFEIELPTKQRDTIKDHHTCACGVNANVFCYAPDYSWSIFDNRRLSTLFMDTAIGTYFRTLKNQTKLKVLSNRRRQKYERRFFGKTTKQILYVNHTLLVKTKYRHPPETANERLHEISLLSEESQNKKVVPKINRLLYIHKKKYDMGKHATSELISPILSTISASMKPSNAPAFLYKLNDHIFNTVDRCLHAIYWRSLSGSLSDAKPVTDNVNLLSFLGVLAKVMVVCSISFRVQLVHVFET